MRKKRVCLQCDDGTLLEYMQKDLMETVDGRVTRVDAISGWHCPRCRTPLPSPAG